MEIRNINKGLVLRTIEKNGPISRADVGKIVGLTPPTISYGCSGLRRGKWNKSGFDGFILPYY